jgi:DNA polymerase-3 subunit alpha
MRQLFRDHPEACDNTLLIAERCQVEFNTAANYMPRFPVPDGETEDSWLIKEVENVLSHASGWSRKSWRISCAVLM